MKHSAWILSTIFAATAPAFGADKLSLQWGQLAPQVVGRTLYFTTSDYGEHHRARCLRVEPDGLVLENPGTATHWIKIAREKISEIHIDGRSGRNMAHLQNGTGSAFKWLFQSVLTPYAPLGVAGTPVVAAYFVVATPFCALGDLLAKLNRPLDIEIVN
jgi:hypothetical protein